jgi:hypothetical protein
VDLAASFAAISGAEPFEGLPETWRWSHAPKFGFAATLSSDGKHAFQCYAHNSYDEGLARAVLAFAREHDTELIAPPERPLVFAEGFSHTGYAFDIVAAVGPAVHRYHPDAPEMHDATRAVFPAYRCEVAGDEDEEETQFRYARAGGLQPTRWDRRPNPFLKMRHRAASGREIPDRGFANPSKLVLELTAVPDRPEGFVEFENYLRQVWRVDWNETYVLHGPDGEERRAGFDELIEFTKDVLLGPSRSAGEASFEK